jgi:hypothetical protein
MSVRKLLSMSLALALVYSISLPARADLLKNFKADGSIETRSFGIDNETDRNPKTDDYRSETVTRLMAGGSFDLLDDVHSRIQLLKNDSVFGSNGTGQGQNLNDVQSAIDVVNAYVKVDKIFNHVDLTIGRQFYGRSDDLVIYYGANNDDLLSVNSVDLFRADSDIMGWAKVQAMAGKLVGNATTGVGANNDTDVFGAEVNSDKVIPQGNLAAYYYTKEVKKDATIPVQVGNNTLNVYGLRAAGDLLLGLSYSAEGIMNGGRNQVTAASQPGYNGNAFLLALKYGQDVKNMPIRAGVEWGRGTNDFTPISAGKRFGIIWGEHSNIGPSTLDGGVTSTGLSNLKVVDATVGVSPIKKLGVDVSWYRFQKSDATIGTGTGLSSLGTELDLVLSWKHSDNVYLEANAATFQVGDALRPAGANAPITRLGGDVKIKF